MKVISRIIAECYGILSAITLGIGALAFLMFLAGFVVGGSAATGLATTARQWIMFAIRTASLATLLGLVNIYLERSHSLTLDQ